MASRISMRMTLELTRSHEERLARIQDTLDLNRADAVRRALVVLDQVLEAQSDGRRLALLGDDGEAVPVVVWM